MGCVPSLVLSPLSLSLSTCNRKEFSNKGQPGSHVGPKSPKLMTWKMSLLEQSARPTGVEPVVLQLPRLDSSMSSESPTRSMAWCSPKMPQYIVGAQ